MICALATAAAGGPVFRLARAPAPWSWLDWSQANADGTSANRWDDPERTYRVLYQSLRRWLRAPFLRAHMLGQLFTVSGPGTDGDGDDRHG